MAVSIGKVVALIKALSSTQDIIVVDDMVTQSTEYLADGNSDPNQEGNYKIDIVDSRLKIFEYISGVWTEVATLGSVISDYFYLDERYSSLNFQDPRHPDIDKNGIHLSTNGEFVGLGDSRFDGIFLNGHKLYHNKVRLINDDIEQSFFVENIQNISNTSQVVNEINATITSPSSVNSNQSNLIYRMLFDIKQDCKVDLKVFNHGETTNPIYQTVKNNELQKGLGFPISANTTEARLLKLLYLTPDQQYDIKLIFENPTEVGGIVDAFGDFKPKLGYQYLRTDDLELFDTENLNAEFIRDLLQSLDEIERLKSSAIYNQINSTSNTLVINDTVKDNYVNGLVLCDNTSGQIDVVINENTFDIGDKLTLKQYTNQAGAPTCRFIPFNGTIDGKSSITLYTNQSATVQCVSPNEFVRISKDNNVDDIFMDMKDPTGFVDVDSVTLSFDNTSRTLSLSPIGVWYEYYTLGLKHRIDTTKTITIPNVTGKYYFYLDSNQELQYINSFNMDTLFYNNAYVSVIYWSAEDNKRLYFGKETHGINMQGKVHEYLHTNFGARYKSGLGLFNFQIDGDGTSDYHARFQYDSGVIYDEDIQHLLSGNSILEQPPIYYRVDTNRISRKEGDSFPLIGKNDITITTRPKYNQNISGDWQLTEVGVNDYWLVHYFATNDIDNPVIGWLGNSVYENKTIARDSAYNEINTLSGLPFEEFVPIASVIFKTDSYTNEPNAIIVSTDDGGSYIDFRGTATVEGITNVAEHGSLTGLTLPNAHPATSIDVDVTNLNGNLFGAGNTSQSLFDAIDNLSIEEEFAEIRIIDTGLPKEVRTARQLEGSYSMRLHMRNVSMFDTLSLELNGLQIASGIPKVEGYSTFSYTISEAQSTSGTNLFVAELPVEITVQTGTPQIYNGSVLQKYTTAQLEADGTPFAFDFRFLDLYHSMERVEDLLGNHFCTINLMNNIDLIEEINIQMTMGSITRTLSHNLTTFNSGRNIFQASITQENVDAFLGQLAFDNMITISVIVSGHGSSIFLDGGEIHIEEFDNKNRHVIYNSVIIDTLTDTIGELESSYPVASIPEFGYLVAFDNARTLDNLGAFGISNRFNLDLGQGALINIENDGNDNYIFRLITPYYDSLCVRNHQNNRLYTYLVGNWEDGLSLPWGELVGNISNQTDLVNYVETEDSEIRIIDSGLGDKFADYQSLLGTHTMKVNMNNIDRFGIVSLEMNDGVTLIGSCPKQEGSVFVTYQITQANIDYLVSNNKPSIQLTFAVDSGSPQIYGHTQAPDVTFIDGSATWGNISGTITNQTDLVNYINNQLDELFESSDNVDTYEDNDYIYTVVGVDNDWYVDRMAKVDPFLEDRHPISGNATGLKPVSLLEVQGLIYG